MSSFISRRTFCGGVASSALFSAFPSLFANPPADTRQGISLCIGNYGMQSYKVEVAVQLIADLGFDGIELTMMPEFDSSPEKLNQERRDRLRQLLENRNLSLTSLMENLPPSAVDIEHQKTIDRLKRAAELGRDLCPSQPPLIQTVLGGGTWSEKKELFRDRLGDWLRVAESTRTMIAIKPHRMGAMSQPLDAVWLLSQLGNSPWLGMVYDYSHYALRDLSIDETIKAALPSTVLVAVKDVVQKGDLIEFALPGESNAVEHTQILSTFYKSGYRRSVCCEVSAQVSKRAGYDAAVAAKTCYENMNRLFETSEVPRRRGTQPTKKSAP